MKNKMIIFAGIQYYKRKKKKDLGSYCFGWDMAFKDKQINSKTGYSIWVMKGANRYLLKVYIN